MSRLRLEVDAAAAKPQREGDSQESWSRPGAVDEEHAAAEHDLGQDRHHH
jgi:hypothetical protein